MFICCITLSNFIYTIYLSILSNQRYTEVTAGSEGASIDQSQVINLTRVTDRFLKSVLEGFEGGKAKNEFGDARAVASSVAVAAESGKIEAKSGK